MRLLYAGEPGTAHSDAWLRFLGTLGQASTVDVLTLASVDLTGVDVLVVDAPWRHPQPEGVTLDHLSVPTVLVGNYGVRLGESLHLKLGTNYGCMCLEEDAIVWDAGHPVFEGIRDAVIDKPAPAHFLGEASRAILDVRETLPTLRVLRDPIEAAGQATAGFGFHDSPECEVIAGGFNEKTQEHFAIGRQGRFLQWGFGGSTDEYTPEGRTLLANCLQYVARFADDPVRALRTTPARTVLQMTLALEGWRGAGLPPEMQAPILQSSLGRIFAGAAPVEARGERPERMAWYHEHAPFVRNDGEGWYVDTDAQDLGLPTHDLAFLDACLKAADDRAARLWERYTGRALDDVVSEAAWLAEHRDHLYFTDWGGYRWISLLDAPAPAPPVVTPVTPVVTAAVGAARYGEQVRSILVLQIPPGYHGYAPGATDGLPLQLTVGAGLTQVSEPELSSGDEHLTGSVSVLLSLEGGGDVLDLSVRVQLCDDLTCYAPQTLELRCPISEGTAL